MTDELLLKLKLQWKIVLLVVLLITGTLSAVIWKTRSFLLADKIATLNDSSIKQIAPLKMLVHDRLEQAKVSLVRAATAHVAAATSRPRASNKLDGQFDVVALLQPGETPQGGQAQWAPAWIDHNPNAKLDSLSNGLELTLLKSLPFGKIKDGETLWERLSDQQGRPVYAAVITVEVQNAGTNAAPAPAAALPDTVDYAPAGGSNTKRAVIVGLAMTNPLADITEEYIGSANSVYVVDDKGYIASHENKAYLGALFSEDPIVHEITSSHRLSASGKYEDLESRPVFGHYERIEHSNLYAVITTPTRAVTDLINSYTRIALLVGGAGCAFGLLALWLLGRKTPSAPESIADAAIATAPAVVAKSDAKTEPKNAKSDAKSDAKSRRAPRQPAAQTLAPVLPQVPLAAATRSDPLSAGFREAMKEPLLAILGHAQLANAKAGDASEAEMRSHTASIEREARRAKDVLEKIETFAMAERPARLQEPMEMQSLLQKALSLRERTLREEEIDLELSLSSTPYVRGSSEQFLVALGNLIDNACTAMRKRPVKKLRVEVIDSGAEGILVRIADTGIGMARDIQERAFEPFFKDFDTEEGLGLGLSIVQSTLAEVGGTCKIESSPGEGATFTLQLPVEDMDRAMFRERERHRLEETAKGLESPEAPKFSLSIFEQEIAHLDFEGPDAGRAFTDDDDEDEMFASVSIRSVRESVNDSVPAEKSEEENEELFPFLAVDETSAIASVSLDVSPANEVSPPSSETPFRVKIRRPKARS